MSRFHNDRFVITGAAAVAAGLFFRNPMAAGLVWYIGIALMHSVEETQGELWAYFGKLTDFPLLNRLPRVAGFTLIVLPAALLQTVASLLAFSGEHVAALGLAMLIGARPSDALLSHLIPFVESFKKDANSSDHVNPGLPTAVFYVVDGLALLALCQAQLIAGGFSTILGAIIGAGFFILVQPVLRRLGRITRWLGWC